MASISYNEIVQRLERLEPSEIWLLLGEIQTRVKVQPKLRLEDFAPTGALNAERPDWVADLRCEWPDEA